MELANRHWMKGSEVALECLEIVWFPFEGSNKERKKIRKTKQGVSNEPMSQCFFLTVCVCVFTGHWRLLS